MLYNTYQTVNPHRDCGSQLGPVEIQLQEAFTSRLQKYHWIATEHNMLSRA